MEGQPDPGCGKGPPRNLEAEQAFLGALFANNKVFDMVGEFLLPEHFYDHIHGHIFSEALELHKLGRVVDAVTLKSRLEHTGALEEVGGTGYLAQLITAMVGITNARDYAMAIFETWQQRQLLDIGWDLLETARVELSPARFAGEIAVRAERIAIGTTALTTNRRTMADAMTAALQQVEETMRSGKLPGIATGLASMDRRTGGLKPGLVYAVGGRTGMGKTGLAQVIARNVARGDSKAQPPRTPNRVLYLAMEMSCDEMGLRDLSAITRIPAARIQVGAINPLEYARMVRAAKDLGNPPLTYDDTMALTPREVDLRVRQAKKDGGIDLLIVDHMHLMRPNAEDARLDRTHQLSAIINGLLKIARDHRIPVLVLVQLNRGTDSREDKRPTLVDIRQCGTVEETCHAVVFVYRADYYQTSDHDGESRDGGADGQTKDPNHMVTAELIWAKNRGGAPGTDEIYFHGPTTSFQEYWNR